MQVWPKTKLRIHAGVGIAMAAVGIVGALLEAWSPAGVLVTALAGGLWYAANSARYYRRRALVAEAFPDDWRRILERRVEFYRLLEPDSEARGCFEDDIRIFLAEQNIYAAGGPPDSSELASVDDETRLLIAASAAMLGHGMPNFEWPRMRDIVVFPRAFDEDYGHGSESDIAGMVHYQGPILYSQRDLKLGFRRHDGHNVGLHELAHVLDMADGHADGVPVGAGWASSAPWLEVISDRLKKLRRRRGRYRHVLRDYAKTNEAELFAVAVETFFERPRKLAEADPELYGMLRDYFGQDPAAQPQRRRSNKFR